MLIHGRGTRGTFDKWADQVGDESYRFSRILPFFKRSALFQPPDNAQRLSNSSAQYNASDWSSTGGPLHVSYASWVNPVSSWLARSFAELGLDELRSFMSGTLLGWSWLAVTLDPSTQTRSSSEYFLRDALAESTNLMVYKNTLAKQIIFTNGRASGVRVDSSGVVYDLHARKEIILSAGVVCLPPLHIILLLTLLILAALDEIATDAYGQWYRSKKYSCEPRYKCNCRSPWRWPEHVGKAYSSSSLNHASFNSSSYA